MQLMCSAERYSILSTSISKILTKKHGIHKTFLNAVNNDKIDPNAPTQSSNKFPNYFENQISIGCLRSVTEWLSATSELVKASRAASKGSIWNTDLGRDLARALISRRLSMSFTDLYEVLKFFAYLKDDKLQIIPKLLDVEQIESIVTEEGKQPSEILNVPLLLYMSDTNPEGNVAKFVKTLSKYIKESKQLKTDHWPDLTYYQIGLANLGFTDQYTTEALELKSEETASLNPYYIQLLNIWLLSNLPHVVHNQNCHKLIEKVDKNLDIIPLSHLATHTLIRAMLYNTIKIDNTHLFNVILNKYHKMLLDDKIISVWSLLSLDPQAFTTISHMVNDIFAPENIKAIPKHLTSMVDQIYVTAKLNDCMPSYNVTEQIKPISNLTCNDKSIIDRISDRIKLELKNKGIEADFNNKAPDLPYYKFDIVITQKGENTKLDFKGIIVTTYNDFNTIKNPLLYDPFHILRGHHIRIAGYKEVQIPTNYKDSDVVNYINLTN